MSDIRLKDAKINFQGHWLSAKELTAMLKGKLDAGDLKVADIAAALEELNAAMENSHTLEERVVVTKEVYEKLVELGGEDDKASVYKAVMEYIQTDGTAPAGDVAAHESTNGKSVIKCTKCKALIEVPSDKRPVVFDCPICGTGCRLTL